MPDAPAPGTGQPQPAFVVEGLAKWYRNRSGAVTAAIGDIGLTLHEREFISVVGPSGCGKTTLLRCLSGLLRPDRGLVTYQGHHVRGVVSGLSLVFQEYNRSLFPWLSVERNVAFPLRHLAKHERRARVAQSLLRVGLGDVSQHYPWQLSGGMQQRVSLARAIASRPRCLLLDEPFASVDAQTRESLEDMTLEIWESLGLAVLLVTHDIDEAIYMADRVLVLSPRPSRVIAEVAVHLPRPRDQVETRSLPRFQDLRREIHALIGGRDPGREEAAVETETAANGQGGTLGLPSSPTARGGRHTAGGADA